MVKTVSLAVGLFNLLAGFAVVVVGGEVSSFLFYRELR